LYQKTEVIATYIYIFFERSDILYDRFRQLLNEKGITPYRLAQDTGISQTTLCDWKSGKSKPKLDKLIKIANYLNVSLEELIKEEIVRK
jgi:transcriptional regulator with XRE-family HTH domain